MVNITGLRSDNTTLSSFFFFLYGMHHWGCVAPNADISLQRVSLNNFCDKNLSLCLYFAWRREQPKLEHNPWQLQRTQLQIFSLKVLFYLFLFIIILYICVYMYTMYTKSNKERKKKNKTNKHLKTTVNCKHDHVHRQVKRQIIVYCTKTAPTQ